jgi:hypothetical protein
VHRLALLLLLAAGCTGSVGGGAPGGGGAGGDDDGSSATAPDAAASMVPGAESVARARLWVAAKLHYCQAPNGGHDLDADCPSTCEREANPDWDPYRSDCSGLVSWAWMLPAPGRTTAGFAPFDTSITHAIAAAELRPGDAVNNDSHVMLFVGWKSATEATFIDEPGCSSTHPYAEEFDEMVTPDGQSIAVQYYGSFTAIRYDDAP